MSGGSTNQNEPQEVEIQQVIQRAFYSGARGSNQAKFNFFSNKKIDSCGTLWLCQNSY